MLKISEEKRNKESKGQIQTLIYKKEKFQAEIQSKNEVNIQNKVEESPLQNILNNPGLVHIAENIFGNFTEMDVEVCQGVNQSSKEILNNPMFWLRRFRNLSKENQQDWIKVLQSVKTSKKEKAIFSHLQWKLKKEGVGLPCYSTPEVQDDFIKKIWKSCYKIQASDEEVIQSVKNFKNEKAIISYLQWNLKKDTLVDLPCYNNPDVQDDFRKRILEICIEEELSDEDTEIVKILAPLTDNPNAPTKYRETPIHRAALFGYTEIVKILAPLTDNPNAQNFNGDTPYFLAARNGHLEICRILKSFKDFVPQR